MKGEIKINRRYTLLFLLLIISLIFEFIMVSTDHSFDHVIGTYFDWFWLKNSHLEILVLPLPFLLMLPVFHITYDFARDEDKKKTMERIYSEDIPNAEDLFKMKCIMCENKIDRPTNLIEHLGPEQTKNYLQFCNETGTRPSLYCCSCYKLVEKNPNWQKSMDEMIDNAIQYHKLKKDYQERVLSI